MSWSSTTWQQSSGIYDRIIELPFIQELILGTLAIDKFKFYIEQDSIYLAQFGRTLSLIAARAHQMHHVLNYIRFAEGAIVVENALHASYFKEHDIDGNAAISPACHYYTSYLLSTSALAQVEVAMAAVLPCFWVYQQVGDFIYQQQRHENNPYKNWINTYAGEDFRELVKKAITICDEVANTCSHSQQQAMTDAFLTACRLEWLFWESAWGLEKWRL